MDFLIDQIIVKITSQDRKYLSDSLIRFALQADPQIIFLDRWFPTCMAYQSLNEYSQEYIYQLHVKEEVVQPDFFLNNPSVPLIE